MNKIQSNSHSSFYDTSNNINASETSNFTIYDNINPEVASLSCAPNPANISQNILCLATITDEIGLSTTLNTTIEFKTLKYLNQKENLNM